jgi:hypothetical protein
MAVCRGKWHSVHLCAPHVFVRTRNSNSPIRVRTFYAWSFGASSVRRDRYPSTAVRTSLPSIRYLSGLKKTTPTSSACMRSREWPYENAVVAHRKGTPGRSALDDIETQHLCMSAALLGWQALCMNDEDATLDDIASMHSRDISAAHLTQTVPRLPSCPGRGT